MVRGSAGTDTCPRTTALTVAPGSGPEVKRRIILGTYALSAGYYDAYYLKARQVRKLIKAEVDEVLVNGGRAAGPRLASVAFKIGAKTDDPLLMYLNDICTLPVNIAGCPGLSVPCGLSEGLPVGLQVIGRGLRRGAVLRVADAYQRPAGFSRLRFDRARLTHPRLLRAWIVPSQAGDPLAMGGSDDLF